MVIIIGSPKPIKVSRASEPHCGPAKIDFGWPDCPTREKVKYGPCPLGLTFITSMYTAALNKNILKNTAQVSGTEENLPRHTHCALAQLRTNKSPFLLSYLHKIDASTHPSPLCPLCRTHEHTTQHLFSCP